MLASLRYLEDPPGANATDRKKALIFAAVCASPSITRKQLGQELRTRPSTVSDLVAELLAQRLLVEGDHISGSRKGRPEISLHPALDRFAVIVVHVVSNAIRGVVVDMGGRVLAESKPSSEVGEDAVNDGMAALFLSTTRRLQAMVPPQTEVIGVGLALPGIVDEVGGRWIFCSRWPRMSNMTFEGIGRATGLPVRLIRNLNAELGGHLMSHPEERTGGVLFVHWGFGIGASYARDGVTSLSSGSFGEFGHWIGWTGSDRRCRCGKPGCLETEAALWALLGDIRRDHPDAPGDEWAFEEYMRRHQLGDRPSIRAATRHVAAALHNLHMVLFPRRIILTGPFVQDPQIFESLKVQFTTRLPDYALGVSMATARRFAQDEIAGTAVSFFDRTLRRCLVSGAKEQQVPCPRTAEPVT